MNVNENIKKLCSRKFGCSPKNIKYLGGGSYGKVYKAELSEFETVVFKFYAANGIASKEALSLHALSQNSKIKIPKVHFVLEKGEECPQDCLCMEYINGKNAFLNIKLLCASKRVKNRFADEVVDALLAVHSIQKDKFGYVDNAVYNTWQDFYKPFALDIYENAKAANMKGCFDKYILDVMEKAVKYFDYIFDEPVEQASLIHGDINVMNIMVDKNCRTVAFIDPLNSMFADREYELFQLENLTGNVYGLLDTYKSKYKVSEKFDLKCAFYSLWNEAMVYLNTGKYTGFIMKSAVNKMKKELKKL